MEAFQTFRNTRVLSTAIAVLLFFLSSYSRAVEIKELTFASTYDQSQQRALLQLPDGYDENRQVPLLLWVQGMYTDAQFGINYIGAEVNRRGWLVVAAEMHGERTGGKTNLGAPAARQDLIDTLNLVVDNYPVDTKRIYLAGISMGGLTGGLTLADHPEPFASAALLMTITDLRKWYEDPKPYSNINADIVKECGGTPEEKPEEYANRNMLPSVPTLARIPLMVCHGSSDSTVPPAHSQRLIDGILEHKPADLYVYWFEGDHSQEKINQRKVLDFLAGFSKQSGVVLAR